jgi:NAD(P)H-nitrite reductase large subunit
MPDQQNDIIICRCEDITLGEILDGIEAGLTTVTELKNVLRVSMGPCQGKGCLSIIRAILAERLGVPPSAIQIPKKRPPFMPIKIGSFLKENIEE